MPVIGVALPKLLMLVGLHPEAFKMTACNWGPVALVCVIANCKNPVITVRVLVLQLNPEHKGGPDGFSL